MPNEDKNGYFVCSNPKGQCGAGHEEQIIFEYKPPGLDPLISGIEALQGIGQWVEYKG